MREPDGCDKHKQAFENELMKLNLDLSKSPGKFLDGFQAEIARLQLAAQVASYYCGVKKQEGVHNFSRPVWESP